MPTRRTMGSGTIAQPATGATDPSAQARMLLKRAKASAGGALVGDALLVVLFLWGVNPNNLVYSLSVLAQSGILLGFVAGAMLLPGLTLVWGGWLLQLVRRGEWPRIRQWLPLVTGLGYASLIVPGFYLHETIHLLDSAAWPRRPTSPTPVAR